jgi:hypothetical protein
MKMPYCCGANRNNVSEYCMSSIYSMMSICCKSQQQAFHVQTSFNSSHEHIYLLYTVPICPIVIPQLYVNGSKQTHTNQPHVFLIIGVKLIFYIKAKDN